MKRVYKKTKLEPVRLSMVKKANEIIESYQAQGFNLTLRQLYYKFIARDLFPDDRRWKRVNGKWVRDVSGTKNADPNHKWLGDIVAMARMSGQMDWTAIEDRTRDLDAVSHWDSPSDIVRSAASSFRLDKWVDQPFRVEVWLEKDALEGIIIPAAHALDVPLFSCRGYGSLSSLWKAGRRLLEYVKAGQRPLILHLGDHDPSGIDMTRDIGKRLNDFVEMDWLYEELPGERARRVEIMQDIERRFRKVHGPADKELVTQHGGDYGLAVQVRRIALTYDQVQEYNPPPSPTKDGDGRTKKYEEQFGDECWELDALEPQVLTDLVTESIKSYRDGGKYAAQAKAEKKHREDLSAAANRWPEVSEFVSDKRKGK